MYLLVYDQVSGLQGKTPISYLQEMCNKRGITPQYDLIANEGAVHEPLFVFKVTAGEYIGTGKGLKLSWAFNFRQCLCRCVYENMYLYMVKFASFNKCSLMSIFYCIYYEWKLFVCTLSSGTSKKKAKHNAAISLLNQMGVLPALVNEQSSDANGLGICILHCCQNKCH